MIGVDKKSIIAGGEAIKDKILRAAYESLKYYETYELSSLYFINDIAEVAGIAEDTEIDKYENILGYQYLLRQERFIRIDNKTGLIKPTEKLLNKFRD